RRWVARATPRITGATLAKNELWFAWAVDRNSNHRPRPCVQIARRDASNMTLIDNVNVFDQNSATAYAALSTNENDEVGISYMIGGGPLEPSHVVGILTGGRKDVVVARGDRGPLDPDTGKGEWGDYLTVRRVYPNQKLFTATGYTMKGPEDGSNRDATPRFVVFGRAADAGLIAPVVTPPSVVTIPPVVTPVSPTTVTPSPGVAVVTAVSVGPPFKDVNALPVVIPTVAAAIKNAAMVEGQQ